MAKRTKTPNEEAFEDGQDAAVPRSEYDAYIQRRSAAGNWFMFFRDYLEVMTRDESLMIQCIVNCGQRPMKSKLARKMQASGFILCTVAFIESTLKIGKNAQARLLKNLCEKKFIRTRFQGVPPRRFVYVDCLRIDRAIDRALSLRKSPSVPIPVRLKRTDSGTNGRTDSGTNGRTDSGTLIDKDKGKKKTEGHGRPLRADGATPGFSHLLNGHSTNGKQEPPSKARRYAVQLKDLLDKHRQLMRRPNLGKWSTSMEELLTKRPAREVRAVLDWLEEHLMDTYTPKVRSAESLLLKFSAVEDAMDRHRKKEDGVDENKKPREWWIKQNMLPPEERW